MKKESFSVGDALFELSAPKTSDTLFTSPSGAGKDTFLHAASTQEVPNRFAFVPNREGPSNVAIFAISSQPTTNEASFNSSPAQPTTNAASFESSSAQPTTTAASFD
jgi:hypothetical protein